MSVCISLSLEFVMPSKISWQYCIQKHLKHTTVIAHNCKRIRCSMNFKLSHVWVMSMVNAWLRNVVIFPSTSWDKSVFKFSTRKRIVDSSLLIMAFNKTLARSFWSIVERDLSSLNFSKINWAVPERVFI